MGAAWERQEQAPGEGLAKLCLPDPWQTAREGSAFIRPPCPEAIYLPLCPQDPANALEWSMKTADIYSSMF